MALTIYWGSGSPYSWRVLLALELKRVPYESKLLEFSKGDLRTAEHLARSPRGTVPVIEDDGFMLTESLAILFYLDRKHPSPPLFGKTPQESGRVMRIIGEYQAYLDAHVEGFILPLYFGQAEQKAEQIQKSVKAITPELIRFESLASEGAWLVGDAISAADLVLYPALKSLERALSKPAARAFDVPFHPLTERHPALQRFMQRIEALPGYDQTYPPHWR